MSIENTLAPHDGQKTTNKTYSGKRIIVEVEVRPGMPFPGVMLLDGRGYPSGKHMVQIWDTDLEAMQAMVEPTEDQMTVAKQRHELKLAEWIAKTPARYGKPGINSADNYNGSVEEEFRDLTRRERQPLLSLKVVGNLDTIENENKMDQARMLLALQPEAKVDTSGNMVNVMAQMLKTIEKLNSKIEKLEKK